LIQKLSSHNSIFVLLCNFCAFALKGFLSRQEASKSNPRISNGGLMFQSDAEPKSKGGYIHRVLQTDLRFGHHGHVFSTEAHAPHFGFLSCVTSIARHELDALVREWIVPGRYGKPFDAEGVFCGQISYLNLYYAIAIMASVLQVKVYCVPQVQD
jgi:hypothetical protein